MSSKKKNAKKATSPRQSAGKAASSAKSVATPDGADAWPVPNAHKDDLQEIRGIGMSTEAALNRVGILRYLDFSRKTAAEIADLLQSKEGVTISAEEIQRGKWIEQARQLADGAGQAGAVETVAIAVSVAKPETTCVAEGKEAAKTKGAVGATANASALSRFGKSENDETTSPGKQAKAEQAPDAESERPAKAEARKAAGKSSTAAAKAATAETSRLRPEMAAPARSTPKQEAPAGADIGRAAPGDAFAGIVRATFRQAKNNGGAKPILMSDVKLRMGGAQSRPESIHVEVHAEEAFSERNQVLAAATYPKVIQSGELDVRLECRTPRLGMYNLRVVAFELKPDARVFLYNGPRLQIVA